VALLKFHCTYCGYGIESASDSFGTLITCPNCRTEIPVPLKETSPSELSDSPKTNSVPSKAGPKWGHKYRRVFIFSLLGCFVVGAATAILALLSFELGKIQAKILLTTLSLGAYSLTGLCSAVLADQRQFRVFGGLGIAASIAGALFAVLTNWELVTGWEILIKGRLAFLIVALAFGHAALLLMINTTNSGVRSLRIVTLGIIALVAVLFLAITLDPESIAYAWTILGIFSVMDVLGTIATPLLHLATRETRTG